MMKCQVTDFFFETIKKCKIFMSFVQLNVKLSLFKKNNLTLVL